MKYIKLLLIILCVYSCNDKKKSQHQENTYYIIDTTLQFYYNYYKHDSCFSEYQTNYSNIDEIDAFNIACKEIKSLEKDGIDLYLPLRMYLLNDSVWIVYNNPSSNEIVFGGDVYLEIRKKDGCILKGIIGE